ncbi:hypothetical protein SUGI_0601590 [Cryptomeria japonica]|uniref:cytochrome c oxidase subunit 6a, mitochondrial n=1 Tax=Cryptomeria japonica TaxID=3369 RepID=UPI0024147CB7|nr:cytochrome c oxidase subunit 6a, mitochondrial [Cryptomeria japonica]GLJ30402.1 hypothetical protein SUGI_0601590 [Cryptomeria japonica]
MAQALRSGMIPAIFKSRLAPSANLRSANFKRSFASSAEHDDAYETEKWKRITIAGIIACTALGIYDLSGEHEHFDEPPRYPYLHIRNKEFPWGPDGLFERKKHHSEH